MRKAYNIFLSHNFDNFGVNFGVKLILLADFIIFLERKTWLIRFWKPVDYFSDNYSMGRKNR